MAELFKLFYATTILIKLNSYTFLFRSVVSRSTTFLHPVLKPAPITGHMRSSGFMLPYRSEPFSMSSFLMMMLMMGMMRMRLMVVVMILATL